MNLRELSSPIRIYWDVAPATEHLTIDYKGICDQIVNNKVLSLQVSESAPVLSHACLSILDSLKDRTIALSLTVSRSALDASTISLLRNLPLRGLFVSMASEDDLGSIREVKKQMDGGTAMGVSFSVTRDNYRDLPGVLYFCIRNGISYLVLPMQRVMYERDCFYLSRHEREELAARLQEFEIPADLKLIIHDPFLWRVFYPSVAFPDGGCQAANTMLYISREVDVYPCPTLPVIIGNLMRTSLKEIIQSDLKKDVRKMLISAPRGCGDCKELDQCKGGCRGRTYAMKTSLNEPDPSCK